MLYVPIEESKSQSEVEESKSRNDAIFHLTREKGVAAHKVSKVLQDLSAESAFLGELVFPPYLWDLVAGFTASRFQFIESFYDTPMSLHIGTETLTKDRFAESRDLLMGIFHWPELQREISRWNYESHRFATFWGSYKDGYCEGAVEGFVVNWLPERTGTGDWKDDRAPRLIGRWVQKYVRGGAPQHGGFEMKLREDMTHGKGNYFFHMSRRKGVWVWHPEDHQNAFCVTGANSVPKWSKMVYTGSGFGSQPVGMPSYPLKLYGAPPHWAAEALPKGTLDGCIAVVCRGGEIDFSRKIYNAQSAGARGAVVLDYEKADSQSMRGGMAAGAFAERVTIPSMLLRYVPGKQETGRLLREALMRGERPKGKLRFCEENLKPPAPKNVHLGRAGPNGVLTISWDEVCWNPAVIGYSMHLWSHCISGGGDLGIAGVMNIPEGRETNCDEFSLTVKRYRVMPDGSLETTGPRGVSSLLLGDSIVIRGLEVGVPYKLTMHTSNLVGASNSVSQLCFEMLAEDPYVKELDLRAMQKRRAEIAAHIRALQERTEESKTSSVELTNEGS